MERGRHDEAGASVWGSWLVSQRGADGRMTRGHLFGVAGWSAGGEGGGGGVGRMWVGAYGVERHTVWNGIRCGTAYGVEQHAVWDGIRCKMRAGAYGVGWHQRRQAAEITIATHRCSHKQTRFIFSKRTALLCGVRLLLVVVEVPGMLRHWQRPRVALNGERCPPFTVHRSPDER
eukprot:352055-Chlamydomonas_euryale.AAC.1